jgi:hypothetical protein
VVSLAWIRATIVRFNPSRQRLIGTARDAARLGSGNARGNGTGQPEWVLLVRKANEFLMFYFRSES